VKPGKSGNPTHIDGLDTRPWYKEPWPWVLIAIPLLTIIACAYTLYLAVSNPDYLVVEEEEYNSIVEELRASPSPGPEQAPADPDGENGQQ
jgi:hypothetical protein